MFGKEADVFVPFGMQNSSVLIQGILAADSFDTEKVAVALEAMPIVCTPFGMAVWGGKKTFGVAHQLFPPCCVYEIKGNKRAWIELLDFPPLP